MASDGREIRYCAVARRTDNVVIAQRVHVPGRGEDYFSNVRRVLSSPGWANVTTDKLTLDDGDNTFYVLLDEAGRAYIAVASKTYPSRYIYDGTDGRTQGFLGTLQREFIRSFGDASLTCAQDGFTQRGKALLKDLCEKYNDLRSIDKIARVKAQVDDVSAAMQENIKLVLDRGDRVDQLEEKTATLSEQASRFQSGATDLKKHMCKRYWKLMILLALVFIIIIAIIIAVATKD